MKRKLSIVLAIMLVTTSFAGCKETKGVTSIEQSTEIPPIVEVHQDEQVHQDNIDTEVGAEEEIINEEHIQDNLSSENSNIVEQGNIENEKLKDEYTDLPLHEEMNELMYNDMQKLTIMPEEFLDYCESNGFEIEIEEMLLPEGNSFMLYIIAKDDLQLRIGAILDLTNDSVEILYHNEDNASSIKVGRDVATGAFNNSGFMMLGKVIAIQRDLNGNIENIDITNPNLGQLYIDTTMELFEFYKEVE